MKKSQIFILIVVLLLEIFFYFLSRSITPDPKIYFELAARYSARLSFFILCGIFLWMGISGLKQIYASEEKRNFLVFLFSLFTINHLIHFGYLYMNYRVNGYDLFVANKLPGTYAYITIVFAPLILWKMKKLTWYVYGGIYFYLLSILSMFAMAYYGRLTNIKPFPTPYWMFICFLGVISFLVVLNVYRVVRESVRR